MRESVIKKIPYTLVLGNKEVEENKISYRKHGSEETITVTIDEFITLLKDAINNKK